ncbi:hypothetical protein PR202_ga24806 [Eleusine coracana subsp. coracana]|uniref:RING-type domain-containing protein n=1 Tax=Eleusine coracana subsp. coracana TaxID=191504 RepID=A0AAV5D7W0_ELECO|nr:hypothetical protein PR202_ga24806 [Eleusine coracana subsp. coracana]
MRERDAVMQVAGKDEEEEEGGGGFGGIPASGKAIVALHMPTVGETREVDCAVCLEDFKNGDNLRMMPCCHTFHQTCIFHWLIVSRQCPICRFMMPSADEERLLDEQAEAVYAEVCQWAMPTGEEEASAMDMDNGDEDMIVNIID